MVRQQNVTEDSDGDGDEKQDFEYFHYVDVLNVSAYSVMAVGKKTCLAFYFYFNPWANFDCFENTTKCNEF